MKIRKDKKIWDRANETIAKIGDIKPHLRQEMIWNCTQLQEEIANRKAFLAEEGLGLKLK